MWTSCGGASFDLAVASLPRRRDRGLSSRHGRSLPGGGRCDSGRRGNQPLSGSSRPSKIDGALLVVAGRRKRRGELCNIGGCAPLAARSSRIKEGRISLLDFAFSSQRGHTQARCRHSSTNYTLQPVIFLVRSCALFQLALDEGGSIAG